MKRVIFLILTLAVFAASVPSVAADEWTGDYDIPVLESVSVYQSPEKLEYVLGVQELDLTGGKIALHYTCQKPDVIVDMTEKMVTGYNKHICGIQLLTVNYRGKTTTFEVEVVPREITAISIKEPVNSVEWTRKGNVLKLSGGVLRVEYNDNSNNDISITPQMVTKFSANDLKSQEFTVFYSGKETSFNAVLKGAYTPGDINNDGQINLMDVTYLARAVAGWDIEHSENAADVNNDSSVSLADVVTIARYVAGWENIVLY